MQDELRVLSGKSTYKVQGKCIIKGEERDIIASKRPLYKGDEIVGLVGSFVDITEVIRRNDEIKGYLVCAVERSLRIWQENEYAILYYLAELLSDETI